jgi:hypothetical protein
VGARKRKRPLGSPRNKWEGNIKTNLQRIGWGGEWIYLAQNRDKWWAVVNTVMNFWIL